MFLSNPTILTILLLLVSLCSNSHSQNVIDPALKEKIDNYVKNTYLPASGINGLGLAIVQNNGAILYTAGYGMANQAKEIAMTAKSQFVVGSISKGITGVMTAKILQENFPELGESVLDTPIRKLVPQANFTLHDRYRTEEVSFRDLLAHQVCIGTNDMQVGAGGVKSEEEMIYRARYNGESCKFRSKTAYNNQMIELAGKLAASIVNKTYSEAIHDLFEELGMFNSTVVMESDDPEQMPQRAMPHYVSGTNFLPVNYNLTKRLAANAASGGVLVTPDDMARFMRFHLNKGELDGKQIVPTAVVDWIQKPAVLYPGFAYKAAETDRVISAFSYGLGIAIGSFDGFQYIHHGGSAPPYQAHMSLGPPFKVGIFSATNMSPNKAGQVGLHVFILDALRPPPASSNTTERVQKVMEYERMEEEERIKAEEAEAKAIFDKAAAEASKAVAPAILGKYGSGRLGELEITERFNSNRNQTEYFLQYGKWYQGWLTPGNVSNLYKIQWTTDVFQDNFVLGLPREGTSQLAVGTDKVTFTATANYVGEFIRGVSLDTLPVIPWIPESCGP